MITLELKRFGTLDIEYGSFRAYQCRTNKGKPRPLKMMLSDELHSV